MHRLAAALLVLACAATAAEEDPLAKELARYRDAVSKLQKTMDDGVAKERARSIPAIIAIAKRQLAKGDMPGAVRAWKTVLRLDDQHAEARQFFTSINQLEQTLAELEKEESAGGDLLGDDAAATAPDIQMGKPWEGQVTIQAGQPLKLGVLPKGTRITLQYVTGTWTFRRGGRPLMNPDDAVAPEPYRLLLVDQQGAFKATVLTGTLEKPWTFTVEEPIAEGALRISRSPPPAPDGAVTYKLSVAKPRGADSPSRGR